MSPPSRPQTPVPARLLACAVALLLAACGGGGGGGAPATTSREAVASAVPVVSAAVTAPAAAAAPTMSRADAVRLAHQASFGPSEALLTAITTQGAEAWLAAQMQASGSVYTSGGAADVHQVAEQTTYCAQPAHAGPDCWRDNFSTQPLVWDFYRNALGQPDQLRQRVAFALGQLLVVSGVEVEGTYGLRRYHNLLLGGALGNYRELLRGVARSPVMGDYLNLVNNAGTAPNENFARELLQLFSLGTCALNIDGSLVGGRCTPIYDNTTVREYALALTGWTYPSGGRSGWGCWPAGSHCRFYDGQMQPLPALHDSAARTLLSGVRLAAGHDPQQALDAVLDSLLRHPNLAPFVARRLIQHLVASNPSPAYVARVAAAFNVGRFVGTTRSFGSGLRGDLAATVAALLLDAEARGAPLGRSAGRLREPVLLFTGVLRALGGQTDGDTLGWLWGGELRQLVFRAPSVFNFYPPTTPVPGTPLVGPEFALHDDATALQRLNFLSMLIDRDGAPPAPGVPAASGSTLDLSPWAARADDPAALVDALCALLLGAPLPEPTRGAVLRAVGHYTAANEGPLWRDKRARAAAYLVLATPQYQLVR